MAYNGWSNRATWNVSLWLNNDEGLYRELVRLQGRADDKEELAESIKEFAESIWPNGKTPDDDLLRDADWEEFAESIWPNGKTPDDDLLRDAAERYGIKLTSNRVASRPDNSEWQADARHFRCRLSCGRRSFGFYFSQGSAHTQDPTITDALSCIAADASGYDNASSFEDWAAEYGYEEDSRKAERIYRAVKKQAEQLRRTVGEEAYDALMKVCSE